jgi:hypothetical protein
MLEHWRKEEKSLHPKLCLGARSFKLSEPCSVSAAAVRALRRVPAP